MKKGNLERKDHTESKNKMEKKDYLSKDNSNCIKGIFAIIIIFHHIMQFHPVQMNPYVNYIVTSLGYLSVAIFFFFSGYGLEESFCKKKDYLSTFWKRRILSMYGTYFYVLIIYLLVFLAIGRRFSFSTILKSVLLYATIVNNGWFFFAIIVFYILFYVTHKFIKKDIFQMLGVLAGLVLWCMASIYWNFGYWTYLSVFAFALGIFWSHNKAKIDRYAEQSKGYVTGLILLGMSFAFTYLLGHMYSFPESVYLIFQMLSAIIFPALVMWLCMKIPVSCVFTKFLGKYSKYIYAMHGLVLNVFSNEFCIENTIVYILVSLFGSIILAVVVQKIANKINIK